MAMKQKTKEQREKDLARWRRINREKRALAKKTILDIKKSSCCSKCGYNEYPEILVFHHLKKKTSRKKEISYLSKKGDKIEKILNEINKCELLCPNCHAIHHIVEKR